MRSCCVVWVGPMSNELHFGDVESVSEEELLSDWVSSVSLPSACFATV